MLCTADLTAETEDPPMIEGLGHRLELSIRSFLTALIAISGTLVKVPTDLCCLDTTSPGKNQQLLYDVLTIYEMHYSTCAIATHTEELTQQNWNHRFMNLSMIMLPEVARSLGARSR